MTLSLKAYVWIPMALHDFGNPVVNILYYLLRKLCREKIHQLLVCLLQWQLKTLGQKLTKKTKFKSKTEILCLFGHSVQGL